MDVRKQVCLRMPQQAWRRLAYIWVCSIYPLDMRASPKLPRCRYLSQPRGPGRAFLAALGIKLGKRGKRGLQAADQAASAICC